MKKQHFLRRVGLVLLISMTIMVIAHAFVFPQETRNIFIDFYDFEKEENIYFRKDIDANTKTQLKQLVAKAENRVANFWGNKLGTPKIIFCETDEDYLKFGMPFMTPASARIKLGTYIIISKDGLDLDIIAHEMSHTELYERIGFFNRLLKIPVWFDEGLAMQVDHRSYYSEKALRARTNNLQNLPKIKKLTSWTSFGNGSTEQIQLHYMAAKHEVKYWYAPEKLKTFIEQLNQGASFDEAY